MYKRVNNKENFLMKKTALFILALCLSQASSSAFSYVNPYEFFELQVVGRLKQIETVGAEQLGLETLSIDRGSLICKHHDYILPVVGHCTAHAKLGEGTSNDVAATISITVTEPPSPEEVGNDVFVHILRREQ